MKRGACLRKAGHRSLVLLAIIAFQGCSPRPVMDAPIRGPESLHGCYEVAFHNWGTGHGDRLGFRPPSSVTLGRLHNENLLTPRSRDIDARWYLVEIPEGHEQASVVTRDHLGARYDATAWPEDPGAWVILEWSAQNAGLRVAFHPVESGDLRSTAARVSWWPLGWEAGLPRLVASVARRECEAG